MDKYQIKEWKLHVDRPSVWETGAFTRFCNCGGPTIPVLTDGDIEFAICPMCRKKWNVNTYHEIECDAR